MPLHDAKSALSERLDQRYGSPHQPAGQELPLGTFTYPGLGNRHLLRPSQSGAAHVLAAFKTPTEGAGNPPYRDQGRASIYK